MVNVKEIEGKDFNIKRSAEEDRILSFKDHVCIGCGLMFLWCLRSIIEESRAEKLKKLENKNPESEE